MTGGPLCAEANSPEKEAVRPSMVGTLKGPDPLKLSVCSNPTFMNGQFVPFVLVTVFFAVLKYLREKKESSSVFIVSEV